MLGFSCVSVSVSHVQPVSAVVCSLHCRKNVLIDFVILVPLETGMNTVQRSYQMFNFTLTCVCILLGRTINNAKTANRYCSVFCSSGCSYFCKKSEGSFFSHFLFLENSCNSPQTENLHVHRCYQYFIIKLNIF